MTLSSDARPHVAPGRSGRVLRGHAVEHAQTVRIGLEPAEAAPVPKRQTPGELMDLARQESYQEGYRAGLAEARLDAERARDAALARMAAALEETASRIESGRARAVSVAEEDATTLALGLTRALVDHELSQSDEEISASIRRALRLTSPGEDLVVRLHPDELVDPEELEALVSDCRITVVPDDSVEPGGCVVDAGPCRIDAQIDAALARVRWALHSASPSASAGGDDEEPAPAPGRDRARTQP